MNKNTSGHYTVCNQGHHGVSLKHDDNEMSVAGGDCVGIEAKTVTVIGTNEEAKNAVTVHHHHN